MGPRIHLRNPKTTETQAIQPTTSHHRRPSIERGFRELEDSLSTWEDLHCAAQLASLSLKTSPNSAVAQQLEAESAQIEDFRKRVEDEKRKYLECLKEVELRDKAKREGKGRQQKVMKRRAERKKDVKRRKVERRKREEEEEVEKAAAALVQMSSGN